MTDKKYVDYIIGKGQVGEALGFVLNGSSYFVQYVDPTKGLGLDDLELMPKERLRFLHICFRLEGHEKFADEIMDYAMKIPHEVLIIHSTVIPGELDKINGFDFVYSPIRGQHEKLEWDLKRYTKYLSSKNPDMVNLAIQRFNCAGISTERISDVKTLEWTKHLANTLYYHWIVAYRQYVHIWCNELGLDEEALWSYTKELHDYTGVQFPTYFDEKGIGGHCVLQNSMMLKDMKDKPEHMEKVLDDLIRLNEEIKGGK